MTRAAAAVAAEPAASQRAPAPFLKWVGGKRRLVPEILPRLLPPPGETDALQLDYVEPFVGGGAVFFALAAIGLVRSALLNDSNRELAQTYLAIQRDPARVVAVLRDPARGYVYEERAYYRIRALDPEQLVDQVDVAARMIYLNKCGFNGLYRVNKSGGFNVPFGSYENPTVCDEAGIRAASRALRRARIRSVDFEVVVDEARASDVMYVDPPYLPLSATSSFTAYTGDGFCLGDHERLRDALLRARERGVRFVLSNCAAPAILSLYDRPEFVVDSVDAARAVNSDASKRGKVRELLVTPAPLEVRCGCGHPRHDGRRCGAELRVMTGTCPCGETAAKTKTTRVSRRRKTA